MDKVLIYLAPGFEELEAVTIIDLLRRAGIDVTIAGLEREAVTGSHEITITCDAFYEDVDADDFDYLILPGGQPGTNNLKSDKRILEIVRKFDSDDKIIGAICAAPTVLHEAGILNNVKVTSYPLEKKVFDPSLYEENDVVTDGNIVTSRGVGTAIDFTLDIIGKIKGNEVKLQTAERILWSQIK
jgi:4-methyl-5(b-hydroxyethyl)-thiazole monophosphate biosynthesis